MRYTYSCCIAVQIKTRVHTRIGKKEQRVFFYEFGKTVFANICARINEGDYRVRTEHEKNTEEK